MSAIPKLSDVKTTDSGGNKALNVVGELNIVDPEIIVDIDPAGSGTSSIVSIGTSPVEVTAATNQLSVTITNLESGNVYYRLNTGVTTSDNFLKKREQLILNSYAGSVFLIKSSGSNNVQVDRKIK